MPISGMHRTRSSSGVARFHLPATRNRRNGAQRLWQGKGVRPRSTSSQISRVSDNDFLSRARSLKLRKGSSLSPSGASLRARSRALTKSRVKLIKQNLVTARMKHSDSANMRLSDTSVLAKEVKAIDENIVAGRGKVRTRSDGYIEKEMGKWEIVNYVRIKESPKNQPLVEYMPPIVCDPDGVGKESEIKRTGKLYEAVDVSLDDAEFPVVMTNVVPSGKFLDVKLGDIISPIADKIHGKKSFTRHLKRPLHMMKQYLKKSGVTIQNHSEGLAREWDEMQGDQRFIPLLMKRAGLEKYSGSERNLKMVQLILELRMLKQAVQKSEVGFIGCSLLLSLEKGDRMVTLIDVENCFLPEDPGVTPKAIKAARKQFVVGINSLITRLEDQLPE